MNTQTIKTKESGKIRNIVMETGRAYRIASLRYRLPKDQGRECVLVDIVSSSPKRPDDMVAKIRFTDDGKLGRAKLGDLLPVGEPYEGEYTEDDPTHRPEDYGWEDLDLPEDVQLDMVERAKAGRRLTQEQYDAIDRHRKSAFSSKDMIVFFPSNSSKMTREQAQAGIGGPERAELAGKWLSHLMLALGARKQLEEGITDIILDDGSPVPIERFIAGVERQRDEAQAALATYDRSGRRWEQPD